MIAGRTRIDEVNTQSSRNHVNFDIGVIVIATFLAGILLATSQGKPVGLLFGLIMLTIAGIFTYLHLAQNRSSTIDHSQPHALDIARFQVRAVSNVASTLGSALDYDKVLNAALDIGVLGLKDNIHPTRYMIGMVMLFRDGWLRVVSSRRLTRQDLIVVLKGQQGALGETLRKAEPTICTDPHNDPELGYIAALQDCKSVLLIPLRANLENYGVLVFGTPDRNAFDNEQFEMLTGLGSSATVALQNAVLYENLRKEKERIVEVEEEARKKLARDLHDGPTQSVSAIAMRLDIARRMLKALNADTTEVFEELKKIEDIARSTTKEIRHMLFTLRPLVLETQGLRAALEQLSLKLKDTHNLNVTLQAEPGVEDLIDGHAQGTLFYIVEEAVNNARKHAQAAQIFVRLYRHGNIFVCEIQDNGVGFDVEAVTGDYSSRGSLGMINMQERAALIEGRLRLESAVGKGTKISVFVPVRSTRPHANASTKRIAEASNGTNGN